MKILLFPGQGTQKVGMFAPFISAFPIAKQTLEEIEDAVHFKISSIVEDGTNEELSKTDNAQLAIFSLGAICLTILQKEYGFDLKQQCKYLAGHSLGEYTALYASGVFNLRDMSKIVRKRGKLMAEVCKTPQNYIMTAIVGKISSNDESLFEKLKNLVDSQSEQPGICVIANDNSNTQIVLSGHANAVKNVIEAIMGEYPTLRAINLNTSGAFHSPLMSKSAIELDEYLSGFSDRINEPQVPVISNVSATPIFDKTIICNELVSQIVNRVRWRETIDMVTHDNEIDEIVELCPGHVLSGMLKRDYPDMLVTSLETMSQIDDFMKR